MLVIYSSIATRARLGVLLRTSDHKQYYPPRTNTCCNARSSRRPPSLIEQRFERRGGYVWILPNGYKVVRSTIVVTTVDEYTLKSAYNTAKKGCAGHDVQKRESSWLQIARRSTGLPSSSLPSAPHSIAFPNNRSSLTSYHLEPPSTARPPFFPPAHVASSRPPQQDFFSAQHILSWPRFKEPGN